MEFKRLLQEPLNVVQGKYFAGLISQREYDRYKVAWAWSVPRLTGTAGLWQDSFAFNRGNAALTRRINRVRKVLGLAPI